MREPVDNLYLFNTLLDCAYEQNAHGFDRRGYGGQQKGTIVMLVDCIRRFELLYW